MVAAYDGRRPRSGESDIRSSRDGVAARTRAVVTVAEVIAHYRFEHRLAVPAPSDSVRAVLLDLERYPRWWPQIRAVGSLGQDTALVVCRSVLPYDLELVLEAVRREAAVLEVRLSGGLDGFARWRLESHGSATALSYEQEVDARGALAAASYPLRPLLRWNHAAMMRGFDRGLPGALGLRPGEPTA